MNDLDKSLRLMALLDNRDAQSRCNSATFARYAAEGVEITCYRAFSSVNGGRALEMDLFERLRQAPGELAVAASTENSLCFP
jgi:hypothetical protein